MSHSRTIEHKKETSVWDKQQAKKNDVGHLDVQALAALSLRMSSHVAIMTHPGLSDVMRHMTTQYMSRQPVRARTSGVVWVERLGCRHGDKFLHTTHDNAGGRANVQT